MSNPESRNETYQIISDNSLAKKMKVHTNTQKEVIGNDHSLSITANAGSGKTSLLVDKLLHLLIENNIPLDNVAAITFTRKAAGEMRQKLADVLQERFLHEKNSDIKAKLYSLRSKIASANIRTIHSFCKEIISSFPVEAGVDMNFSILEEQNTGQLVTDIIEATLIQADQGDDISPADTQQAERLRELIRFFGGKKEIITVITRILAKRRLFTLFLEEYEQDGDNRAKRLEKFHQNLSDLFFDKEFDDLIQNIRKMNLHVLENNPESEISIRVQANLDQLSSEPNFAKKIKYYRSICNDILLKDKVAIRTRGYVEREYEDRTLIEQTIKSHQTAKLRSEENAAPSDIPVQVEDLIRFQKAVADLGKFILHKYTERKQAEGMLDNEDLIIKTRELLSNGDIIASLQEKIRILMVDEYQDTDDIQYDIFKPILNDLKDEMHTLFIVGDKKQSIYSFREADLEVFEKTRNDIENVKGGKTLLLKESFRMAPAIAAFTNHLFKVLFHNPRETFNEVGFDETVCAYPYHDQGGVTLLFAPEREAPTKEQKDTKGRIIARKIIQLSKEPGFSYSDVMILARKHSFFTPLMIEFAKQGIPYVYSAGKNFYQSQIIRDISTFLSVLVDPLNREAMIALLRSPFFMISDEEIVTLVTAPPISNPIWTRIQETEVPALKHVAQILKGLLSDSKVLSLPSLIKKIVTESGMTVHAAQRYDGQQQVANIEKLIEIALLQEAEGKTGLFDFSRFLTESIAESASESDAELISEQGKVALLTIHSAKGLQAKTVFLILGPDKIGAIHDAPVYLSKQYGPLGRIRQDAEAQRNKYEPWLLTYHKFVQMKKEEAELKRLFYVAVTRAENQLFLVLHKHLKDYSSHSSLDSLLYQMPELQVEELSNTISFTEALKRSSLSDKGEWQEKTEDFTATLNIETMESIDAHQENNQGNKDHGLETGASDSIAIVSPSLTSLSSSTSGEIFSASAYALYKQCPLKYYLTLMADFGKITTSVDEAFEFELENLDEETDQKKANLTISPSLRGSILHYLLEKKVPSEAAMKAAVVYLHGKGVALSEEELITDLEDIATAYNNYINSRFWGGLQTSQNASSEYQFYLGLEDFICLGVIDLIIEHETVVQVIDFKSNNIPESRLNSEAEKYVHQMNLYSLAASRLYPDKEIQVILSFIRHPNHPIGRVISKEDIHQIENDLISTVRDIRNGVYPPNTTHCGNCIFAENGRSCIRNR